MCRAFEPHQADQISDRKGLAATMTPSWLAADMVALAMIQIGDDILEPSAGSGAIVKQILKVISDKEYLTAFELNKALFKELAQIQHYCFKPYQGNFLLNPIPMGSYNRIIMNPPHRGCVDHVTKAYSLLREGGRLVALVHSVYLDQIKILDQDVRIYHLPRETFVIEDKEIEAAVVVMDRI